MSRARPLPREAQAPLAVLFPSELGKLGATLPQRLVLAGRVVGVSPSELILADALGQCRVELKHPEEAPPLFAFCQLEVDATEGRFGMLSIVSQEEGGESRESVPSNASRRRAEGMVAMSHALFSLRGYFLGQDFIEVRTPTLGVCPGLDPGVYSLGKVSRQQANEPNESRQGALRSYLMTSPEFYMKRLLTGGMPRIFQVTSSYRAEELGQLHEPEFSLLEWYRSFASAHAVMGDAIQILRGIGAALKRRFPEDTVLAGRVSAAQLEPRVFTVSEVFARYCQADASQLAAADPEIYFRCLVEKIEPELALLREPVLLTEYPIEQAALARPCPHDARFAERFELYFQGVELGNGYGELTSATEQRRRFQVELERRAETGAPVYPLDEQFLGALSAGLPPCSGMALGLERIVAQLLGRDSIQSVMAFPEWEGQS